MLVAELTRKGRIPVDGDRIRVLRERRFAWTRLELATKIGKSESAIQAIETGATPSVYQKTLRALAEAFGMTLEQAKKELSPAAEWDENVEPYSRLDLLPIPEFDLAVAAGDWSDATELGEICYDSKKSIVQQGLFRIRIRGDSMEKKWPDGCIVEFKCVARDGSGKLEIGKDYCVVRSDETATFKTLVSADDETYTLRAINKRYKKPLVVERSLVTAMARAMGRFEPDV